MLFLSSSGGSWRSKTMMVSGVEQAVQGPLQCRQYGQLETSVGQDRPYMIR